MTFKTFSFEINYYPHNNSSTSPEILFTFSECDWLCWWPCPAVFRRSLPTTPTAVLCQKMKNRLSCLLFQFALNFEWNSYYIEVNGKKIFPLYEQTAFVKCLHLRHKSSSLQPLSELIFLYKFNSKFTIRFGFFNLL